MADIQKLRFASISREHFLLSRSVTYTLNSCILPVPSVKTLIDVIDHLGALIKGHLHLLIPAMIENVSEIETLLRYVDPEQNRDVIDSCKEEIVSTHFSTEILKRVRNLYLFFLAPIVVDGFIVSLKSLEN